MNKLQAGEFVEIKNAKSLAAFQERMELDGIKTEKANAVMQVINVDSEQSRLN